MAEAPKTKIPSLADKDVALSKDLLKAGIFAIEKNGDINKDSRGFFLLNPETYQETKKANWIATQIPGQSDPVYQWLSNGPRQITFDALVTRETSEFDTGKKIAETINSNASQQIVNKFAAIAGTIAAVTTDLSNNIKKAPTNTDVTGKLDITDTLNYYRSLQAPKYDNDDKPSKLIGSPPLIALYVGSSLNTVTNGDSISTNTDVYILTDLRIRIGKQLANLAPMQATVTFTLAQYNVRSFGRNHWG